MDENNGVGNWFDPINQAVQGVGGWFNTVAAKVKNWWEGDAELDPNLQNAEGLPAATPEPVAPNPEPDYNFPPVYDQTQWTPEPPAAPAYTPPEPVQQSNEWDNQPVAPEPQPEQQPEAPQPDPVQQSDEWDNQPAPVETPAYAQTQLDPWQETPPAPPPLPQFNSDGSTMTQEPVAPVVEAAPTTWFDTPPEPQANTDTGIDNITKLQSLANIAGMVSPVATGVAALGGVASAIKDVGKKALDLAPSAILPEFATDYLRDKAEYASDNWISDEGRYAQAARTIINPDKTFAQKGIAAMESLSELGRGVERIAGGAMNSAKLAENNDYLTADNNFGQKDMLAGRRTEGVDYGESNLINAQVLGEYAKQQGYVSPYLEKAGVFDKPFVNGNDPGVWASYQSQQIAYSGVNAMQAATTRIIAGESPEVATQGVEKPDRYALKAEQELYAKRVTEHIEATGRIALWDSQKNGDDATTQAAKVERAKRQAAERVSATGRIDGESNIIAELVGGVVLDPLNVIPLHDIGAVKKIMEEAKGQRVAKELVETLGKTDAGQTLTKAYQIGMPEWYVKLTDTLERGAEKNAGTITGKLQDIFSHAAEIGADLIGYRPKSEAAIKADKGFDIVSNLLNHAEDPEHLRVLLNQFVGDADELAAKYGSVYNSAWAEVGRDAVKEALPELNKIVDAMTKDAAQGGMINAAKFYRDAADAIAKGAEAVTPGIAKAENKIQSVQNAVETVNGFVKGVMSDLYLKTTGYAIRNAIGDTGIALWDGLGTSASFDQVKKFVQSVGGPTLRMWEATTDKVSKATQFAEAGGTAGKAGGNVLQRANNWIGDKFSGWENERYAKAWYAGYTQWWEKGFDPKIDANLRAVLGEDTAKRLERLVKEKGTNPKGIAQVIHEYQQSNNFSSKVPLSEMIGDYIQHLPAGIQNDLREVVDAAKIGPATLESALKGIDVIADKIQAGNAKTVANVAEAVHPSQNHRINVAIDAITQHIEESKAFKNAPAELVKQVADDTKATLAREKALMNERLKAGMSIHTAEAEGSVKAKALAALHDKDEEARFIYAEGRDKLLRKLNDDLAAIGTGDSSAMKAAYDNYRVARNELADLMNGAISKAYMDIEEIVKTKAFDKLPDYNDFTLRSIEQMTKELSAKGLEDWKRASLQGNTQVLIARNDLYARVSEAVEKYPELFPRMMEHMGQATADVRTAFTQAVGKNAIALELKRAGQMTLEEYDKAVGKNWDNAFVFARERYSGLTKAQVRADELLAGNIPDALKKLGYPEEQIKHLVDGVKDGTTHLSLIDIIENGRRWGEEAKAVAPELRNVELNAQQILRESGGDYDAVNRVLMGYQMKLPSSDPKVVAALDELKRTKGLVEISGMESEVNATVTRELLDMLGLDRNGLVSDKTATSTELLARARSIDSAAVDAVLAAKVDKDGKIVKAADDAKVLFQGSNLPLPIETALAQGKRDKLISSSSSIEKAQKAVNDFYRSEITITPVGNKAYKLTNAKGDIPETRLIESKGRFYHETIKPSTVESAKKIVPSEASAKASTKIAEPVKEVSSTTANVARIADEAGIQKTTKALELENKLNAATDNKEIEDLNKALYWEKYKEIFGKYPDEAKAYPEIFNKYLVDTPPDIAPAVQQKPWTPFQYPTAKVPEALAPKRDELFTLATERGVLSKADSGAKVDQYVLNVLNKHKQPEAARFNDLNDALGTRYAEAQRIIDGYTPEMAKRYEALNWQRFETQYRNAFSNVSAQEQDAALSLIKANAAHLGMSKDDYVAKFVAGVEKGGGVGKGGLFDIRAWHGTPHEVDKFSLDKIGTGEGQQVFGWGLYFAENKQIAEWYQEQLKRSIVLYNGKVVDETQPIMLRLIANKLEDKYATGDVLVNAKNAIRKQIAQYQEQIVKDEKKLANPRSFSYNSLELKNRIEAVKENLNYLKNIDPKSFSKNVSKNLYEVNLKPNLDDLLQWDVKISEQPQKIKTILEGVIKDINSATGKNIGDIRASSVYNLLAERNIDIKRSLGAGSPEAASKYLLNKGVSGIAYFDGASRSAGEGTRNFVIFDDKLVDILSKNGDPNLVKPNQLFQFAGERSNMSEQMRNGLETAKAMAANGKSSEEIRAVTGWFEGKYDKKMRYEIPDANLDFILDKGKLRLTTGTNREGVYGWAELADLIDAPELFAAYPEAKKINVTLKSYGESNGPDGAIRSIGDKSFIYLNNAIENNDDGIAVLSLSRRDAVKRILAHEIQHWIQSKEGFAAGGVPARSIAEKWKDSLKARLNPISAQIESLESSPEIKKIYEALDKEFAIYLKNRADELAHARYKKAERALIDSPEFKKLQELKKKANALSGSDPYWYNAGEIEARDVAARAELTPEQLKRIAPYSSENIAEDTAILLYQKANKNAKGAIEFIDDGRAVIRALNSPDVSTMAHESAHLFRRTLQPDELAAANKWAGVADGKAWDVKQEERFARAFEDYLSKGNAPTPELKNVFEQFKDWLAEIYKEFKGMITGKSDAEIEKLFAQILTPAEMTKAQGVNVKAVAEAVAKPDPLAAFVGKTQGEVIKELAAKTGKAHEMVLPIETSAKEFIQMNGRTANKFAADTPNLIDMTTISERKQLEAIQKLREALPNYWERAHGPVPTNLQNSFTAAKDSLIKQWSNANALGKADASARANFAALDYSLKRGFDPFVQFVAPFSYWSTRQGRNFAFRMAERPQVLAHWIDYQEAMDDYNKERGTRARMEGGFKVGEYKGSNIYWNPMRTLAPWGSLYDIATDDPIRQKTQMQENYDMLSAIGLRPGPHIDIPMRLAEWLIEGDDPNEREKQRAQYGIEGMAGVYPVGDMIKGATAALGIGGPAGVDLEGIGRYYAGLAPRFQETYDIGRAITDMSFENERKAGFDKADYILAQSILDRVKQNSTAYREALTGDKQSVAAKYSKEMGATQGQVEVALNIFRDATTMSAKSRGFMRSASILGGMSTQIERKGEEMRNREQELEKAKGYDPLTGYGSRAARDAVQKANPASAVLQAQYATYPGEKRDPLTSWIWEMKDRVTAAFDTSKDSYMQKNPADRRGAAAIEKQKWDALNSIGPQTKNENDPLWKKILDDAKGPTLEALAKLNPLDPTYSPKSIYGANPQEALEIRKAEIVKGVMAFAPKAEAYLTKDGAIDYNAYKAAQASWEKNIIENIKANPLTAKVLLQAEQDGDAMHKGLNKWLDTFTGKEIDTYRQRYDSPMEAMQRSYFDQVYGKAMDKYAATKNWNGAVGDVGAMNGDALIELVKKQYPNRWTDAELKQALGGVTMPSMKDIVKMNIKPEDKPLAEAKDRFFATIDQRIPPGKAGAEITKDPLISGLRSAEAKGLATKEMYDQATLKLIGWANANYIKPNADEWAAYKQMTEGHKQMMTSKYGADYQSTLDMYFSASAADRVKLLQKYPALNQMVKDSSLKGNPLYDKYNNATGTSSASAKTSGTATGGGGGSSATAFWDAYYKIDTASRGGLKNNETVAKLLNPATRAKMTAADYAQAIKDLNAYTKGGGAATAKTDAANKTAFWETYNALSAKDKYNLKQANPMLNKIIDPTTRSTATGADFAKALGILKGEKPTQASGGGSSKPSYAPKPSSTYTPKAQTPYQPKTPYTPKPQAPYTPRTQGNYATPTKAAATGNDKGAFWDAYFAMPSADRYKLSKASPEIARIADPAQRASATSADYAAALKALQQPIPTTPSEPSGRTYTPTPNKPAYTPKTYTPLSGSSNGANLWGFYRGQEKAAMSSAKKGGKSGGKGGGGRRSFVSSYSRDPRGYGQGRYGKKPFRR